MALDPRSWSTIPPRSSRRRRWLLHDVRPASRWFRDALGDRRGATRRAQRLERGVGVAVSAVRISTVVLVSTNRCGDPLVLRRSAPVGARPSSPPALGIRADRRRACAAAAIDDPPRPAQYCRRARPGTPRSPVPRDPSGDPQIDPLAGTARARRALPGLPDRRRRPPGDAHPRTAADRARDAAFRPSPPAPEVDHRLVVTIPDGRAARRAPRPGRSALAEH